MNEDEDMEEDREDNMEEALELTMEEEVENRNREDKIIEDWFKISLSTFCQNF